MKYCNIKLKASNKSKLKRNKHKQVMRKKRLLIAAKGNVIEENTTA